MMTVGDKPFAVDAILLDEACQPMIAGRFDCLQQSYHKFPG